MVLGGEYGQVKHALTCVLAKFRTRRDFAIAVGRNEKVDGGLYAQNNRHATSDGECVVAHVHAARRSNVDGCGDVWRDDAACGDAHNHVLIERYRAYTRACLAVCVCVGDLHGDRDRCRDARKPLSVGDRSDRKGGYRTCLRSGRAACEGEWQSGIGRRKGSERNRCVDAGLKHASVKDFDGLDADFSHKPFIGLPLMFPGHLSGVELLLQKDIFLSPYFFDLMQYMRA